MENAIISLLVLAIVIGGVLMVVGGSFNSVDVLSQSWKEMEATSNDIMRTSITVMDAKTDESGGKVDITLKNDGDVALKDFEDWDVTIDYFETNGTLHILRVPYTETYPPPDNQWSVEGIYYEAPTAEIFEPGIFNPGEEMLYQIRIDPAIGNNKYASVTTATTNGVTTSVQFQR